MDLVDDPRGQRGAEVGHAVLVVVRAPQECLDAVVHDEREPEDQRAAQPDHDDEAQHVGQPQREQGGDQPAEPVVVALLDLEASAEQPVLMSKRDGRCLFDQPRLPQQLQQAHQDH